MSILNLLWRNMKWRLQNRISIAMTIIIPLIWLLLYSTVAGQTMSGLKGGNYTAFVLPGIFVLTIFSSSGSSGVMNYIMKNCGSFYRIQISPVTRSSIVLGHMLEAVILSLFEIALLFILSVFFSVHNISPSTARQKGIILKTYPKLSFSLSVKGDSEMKYRIEEKPAIRLVGIKKKITANMEINFQTIPELWESIKKTAEFSNLCELNTQPPTGVLGVTEYKEDYDFYYYIAAATDKPVPDKMVEYTVPAATWAIFESSLDQQFIKDLYRRFYTEWLPFSGYKYAETHDIEVYPMPNDNSQKCEIWFAIKTQGH